MMASYMTYITVGVFDGYEKSKDTLQNGQLVECEFKEVGRQVYAKGHTYGDGYTYYAIYEYIDENGNHYKAESRREFKSTKQVLEYVESHPTKTLYIDGNGFSISGSETVAKHAAKHIIIVIVDIGLYAMLVGFAVQLIRRIIIKNEEMKGNKNE
ncbi:MAG: hypothetical protein K2N32_00290, partial [Clostridia bacterium]|nr:hypothetical protein [Clostridia bacterium]